MKFTRRDMLRLALLTGGTLVVPGGRLTAGSGSGKGGSGSSGSGSSGSSSRELGASPPTTPFVVELPRPPLASSVVSLVPASTRVVPVNTTLYEIHEMEADHVFHPELGSSRVWGYNGIVPGPTFTARHGDPVLVRFVNNLPPTQPATGGFGVPNSVVHRHGGFQSSQDDGFPIDIFRPGEFRDFFYSNEVEDNDFRTNHSTLWYHDHLVDFTSENVYKGLAGFYLNFDELDTGEETNQVAPALGLPSGDFDIPIVIQDKRFDGDGQLVYDSFDHNGFLGDTFCANGVVQPFLRVARRKYRFRFLNGSNARIYEFFLSNGQQFIGIGSDTHLLPRSIKVKSFRISPAERAEVVIDFTNTQLGQEIFLQNRLQQDDGRKPKKIKAPGTPIIKFIVSTDAADPSRVPAVLRPRPDQNLAQVRVKRNFLFERRHGAWQINHEFFDAQRSVAQPRIGEPEIWTLENGGGGWAHPIHIHLAEFQILDHNGKAPVGFETGQKDTVLLGPGDKVRLVIEFHKFRGRYVFHCHNLEHEDLAMMARFDTV